MPNRDESTQEYHVDYKSALENDSRFHEVDGFYMIAPESNNSNEFKLKSLINNQIHSCRLFLNRFDRRRHSSDEAVLRRKSLQRKISETYSRWGRPSSDKALTDGNMYSHRAKSSVFILRKAYQ
jgi:hypothetical protein